MGTGEGEGLACRVGDAEMARSTVLERVTRSAVAAEAVVVTCPRVMYK